MTHAVLDAAHALMAKTALENLRERAAEAKQVGSTAIPVTFAELRAFDNAARECERTRIARLLDLCGCNVAAEIVRADGIADDVSMPGAAELVRASG